MTFHSHRPGDTSRCSISRSVAHLLTVFALLIAAPLLAATFTVNDLGDAPDAIPSDGICATAGSVCTLRAAIQTANAVGGANVINVPAGTIVLATVLGVGSNITINGAGTGSTVVSGNGVTQVFVFNQGGITVSMNDLTITGGVASAGAGVFVTTGSTLNMSRTLVTGNSASLGIKQGGGLYTNGTLNLTDSTVSNNAAANGGGGIRILFSGTGNIVNSAIVGNSALTPGANGGVSKVRALFSYTTRRFRVTP